MYEDANVKCPRCELETDFIPDGGPIKSISNIRETSLFYRCCLVIGNDIQSGPLYCGDRATIIADTDNPGFLIAACKRHEEYLQLRVDNDKPE